MTPAVKLSVFAAAMVAMIGVSSPPAMARDHTEFGISFDDGSVAFGYRDGYWDRDHRWHRWRHRDDWRYYREHHSDHYYGRNHNYYHNNGWRDEHDDHERH